jgi:CspA family cold shock protein
MKRSTGRVRFFSESKGYGFIMPDDGGADLFVHRKALDAGLLTLTGDQFVSFVPSTGSKGPKAETVRIEQ